MLHLWGASLAAVHAASLNVVERWLAAASGRVLCGAEWDPPPFPPQTPPKTTHKPKVWYEILDLLTLRCWGAVQLGPQRPDRHGTTQVPTGGCSFWFCIPKQAEAKAADRTCSTMRPQLQVTHAEQ